LNRKFLISPIDFEGMHRIEKGEYPIAAIREMLLNALVHRNYMGAPIQIRVYDDKINIGNEGMLPIELTLDALKRSHPSIPRNPIIADVCFKGSYIDAWGRGTIKILDTCKLAGLPVPEMMERDGGFLITVFKDMLSKEQLLKLDLNERQVRAILYVKENDSINNATYQKINDIGKTTATVELQELVKTEILMQSGSGGRGTKYILFQ
ncbi:MAG: transcriptional regulator, partial [Bacteroidales bacterium]|nr:transcriptional regulator [Bacteroidales bacterium]